jgi:hypothetical protein
VGLLALVEENLIVRGGIVGFGRVIIVAFYLEIGRFAIGGREIHVLFLNLPLLMRNSQFFRFLVHTPPDHLNEVRVGVTHLTLALEHQEESILNGILISSIDEFGHFRPFFAQFQEETHQVIVLFISPRPSKLY